jgi:hypothetical protein
VDAAFRHAMLEAHTSEASARDGLSFEQFMVMLRADSRDSLDQYDDRMGGSSRGGAPRAPAGALAGLRVEHQPQSPALAGMRSTRCSTCGHLRVSKVVCLRTVRGWYDRHVAADASGGPRGRVHVCADECRLCSSTVAHAGKMRR